MEIDIPEIVAEVTAEFNRYEKALVTNDVDTLDAIFRDDARTLRMAAAKISMAMARSKPFAPDALRLA